MTMTLGPKLASTEAHSSIEVHSSTKVQEQDEPALSMFVRWIKFNLVGGMGIIVQFAMLFVLKSLLHFGYLAATAMAVEVAVVHNFLWHEQFTWADRTKKIRSELLRNELSRTDRIQTEFKCTSPLRDRFRHSNSMSRLVRFHLTNGSISIAGNLAVMQWMVGHMRMNYLLANAIAIALCSLANFFLSDAWVFKKSGLNRSQRC